MLAIVSIGLVGMLCQWRADGRHRTHGDRTHVALGASDGPGYLLGQTLRRHWLPEYLHDVVTFNLVLGVFIAAVFALRLQERRGAWT